MDKCPFFIRPYHVKEEDKALIDKEMKWLCYLGILKEGFSSYSSPVILISRKLMLQCIILFFYSYLYILKYASIVHIL